MIFNCLVCGQLLTDNRPTHIGNFNCPHGCSTIFLGEVGYVHRVGFGLTDPYRTTTIQFADTPANKDRKFQSLAEMAIRLRQERGITFNLVRVPNWGTLMSMSDDEIADWDELLNPVTLD